jgi:hypothetical protein
MFFFGRSDRENDHVDGASTGVAESNERTSLIGSTLRKGTDVVNHNHARFADNDEYKGEDIGQPQPQQQKQQQQQQQQQQDEDCEDEDSAGHLNKDGMRRGGLSSSSSSSSSRYSVATSQTTHKEEDDNLSAWTIACILSTSFAYGCTMTTLFLITLPVECERIESQHPTVPKSVSLARHEDEGSHKLNQS